jgi:hypothetical protein
LIVATNTASVTSVNLVSKTSQQDPAAAIAKLLLLLSIGSAALSRCSLPALHRLSQHVVYGNHYKHDYFSAKSSTTASALSPASHHTSQIASHHLIAETLPRLHAGRVTSYDKSNRGHSSSTSGGVSKAALINRDFGSNFNDAMSRPAPGGGSTNTATTIATGLKDLARLIWQQACHQSQSQDSQVQTNLAESQAATASRAAGGNESSPRTGAAVVAALMTLEKSKGTASAKAR